MTNLWVDGAPAFLLSCSLGHILLPPAPSTSGNEIADQEFSRIIVLASAIITIYIYISLSLSLSLLPLAFLCF